MSPRARNAAQDPAPHWDALKRVAIVGAATLKGRELKEVLEERQFPAIDVKLLDDDESLGQLDSVGEEATFIQGVAAENFTGVDFAFFASEAEFVRKHWQPARDAGATVIDMSYGLEQEQGAVVRSPWLEKELTAAGGLSVDGSSTLQIAAHPVATVLGLLLLRARRASGIRNAVVTVFEPASEQGRRGMDELHQQTINLLSFQSMPKDVFDSQVAFNILSRYGAESALKLETIEQRILRHFRDVVRAEAIPALAQPSLMLIQGPTFHSHTFSVFLEMERTHSIGDLAQALAGEHVRVTHLPEDAPSNVSAAGQSEIQLSLRRDVQRENGYWLWAAADNLKVAAMTAVLCAETSLRRQAIQ